MASKSKKQSKTAARKEREERLRKYWNARQIRFEAELGRAITKISKIKKPVQG